MSTHYLAYDLGADSGRLMLGTLEDGKVSLEELHRFPNGPVKNNRRLVLEYYGLIAGVEKVLKRRPGADVRLPALARIPWGSVILV